VRGFVLVEYAGAWGRTALQDSRLVEPVRTYLREAVSRLGLKVLLIRRHSRPRGEPLGCRVFAAHADPESPWLESATLDRHEELLDMDLTPLREGRSVGLGREAHPVFLTCTHGRHDPCCAEQGRPVANALAAAHPDLAWEVSHIGGDRFAGNVVVLPHGLYYGRVTASTAANLASDHLAGELTIDLLRGRSGYPMPVQAAEHFLRRELKLTGLDDLYLRQQQRDGDLRLVTFWVRPDGQDWTVSLRVGLQPAQVLTCHARVTSPAPAYEFVACFRPG